MDTSHEPDDAADPLGAVCGAVLAAAKAAGDASVIECATALAEGRATALDIDAVYERIMAEDGPLRAAFAAMAVILARRAMVAADPNEAMSLAVQAIGCANDAGELSGEPGCVRWRSLLAG